jgi:hypothetical protein
MNSITRSLTALVLALLAFASCLIFNQINSHSTVTSPTAATGIVSGELKQWHKVTLTFAGEKTAETANPNPFRDYRLNVTFTQGDKQYTVPGYYAADGNAAETSTDRGDKWRVNFIPDDVGEWQYVASFRRGRWLAVNDDLQAGQPVAFDGASGSFMVHESDRQKPDFRSQGVLQPVGKSYLQFAGTKEYWLKGGTNSPENFLAYYEFDQTPTNKHHYTPHAQDWKPGDPTWQGEKGKSIIGALNYLATKGMNAVYFLTMNGGGDGDDVWPWINKRQQERFDCSKLDQWEIVFSHMDQVGLALHMVTQETENDQLLNWGGLGNQRKLYYRELIARFGHHPALIWNLGEENTNSDRQRQTFINYFHNHDPYHHPVVVHTYPWEQKKIYHPLLSNKQFAGPSLQLHQATDAHNQTLKWINTSHQSGHPWFVSVDEFGPAEVGVKPDAEDYWHNEVRQQVLWGNLMANGSGNEWYFGYQFPHSDLNCEDWRSRDHMWDLTRYALTFFRNYLPFWEMESNDRLISNTEGYALAKEGEIYAIYLKQGGSTTLKLPAGTYTVQWYNPRTGGELQDGSLKTMSGPGQQSIGYPPSEVNQDWAVLVKRQV